MTGQAVFSLFFSGDESSNLNGVIDGRHVFHQIANLGTDGASGAMNRLRRLVGAGLDSQVILCRGDPKDCPCH